MSNREDILADARRRLADQCVSYVRTHHHLIRQLNRAGLLPSPTATGLTASTDQLEAKATEIQRRHHANHESPTRQLNE